MLVLFIMKLTKNTKIVWAILGTLFVGAGAIYIILPSQTISDKLQDKTSVEQAQIKAKEVVKVGAVEKTEVPQIFDGYFEILSVTEIEGGVETYIKAWDKDGNQLGFADGTVEIEKIRIFNPPTMVPDPSGTDLVRTMFDEQTGIITTQNYRFDPEEALKQAVARTIHVKADKQTGKVETGKIGRTTDTYFTGAGDGHISTSTGAGGSWGAAHDVADGGLASYTATTITVQSAEFGGAVGNFGIGRTSLPFDTSALPNGSTISSAVLSIYATVSNNTGNDGEDFLVVVLSNPASPTELVVGDYDAIGDAVDNPTEGSNRVDISGMTLSAYNDLTLDADGIGWISDSSYTILGIREGHDVLDSPILEGENNRIVYSSSEETGTTQDPTLTITYTSSSPATVKTALSKPPNNLGLIGYWSFNEGTSTIATDFSGNGNTATMTNMDNPATPTSGWTYGKLGKALNFDGTNDYVSIPSDPRQNATRFTVSAWVKVKNYTNYNTILEKGDGCIRNYNTYVSQTSGKAVVVLTQGSCVFRSVTSNATIPIDIWTHIVGTYDGENINVYINGVFDNSTPVTGDPDTLSHLICIGCGEPTYDFMSGAIDEVRLYNRALSSSEVAALYNTKAVVMNSSQNNRITDGLVANWSFNGADVDWGKNIVYDSRGNNTGILTNMSTSTSPIGGKVGQALNFDGFNDVITAGTSDTLMPENQPITVSAWIYPRDSNNTRIVDRSDTLNGPLLSIIGTAPEGRLNFLVDGDTDLRRQASNGTLTLNTWHHVVMTWDGSTTASNVHFYVDTVEPTYQTTTDGVNLADNSAATFRIGDAFNGARQFNGIMDEVRIYNRVLSGTEIKQLYMMGLGVKIVP